MKRLLTSLGSVFACILLVTIIASTFIKSADASFTANNIMDDSIFNNSSSMTQLDIQNFLNTFPKSCLKDLIVPYPNNYFSYGGNVLASTAISRVAQLWDINPQVILATLEKESSVVTGNASYGCQYLNTAMGYNCPDNGACPANPADAGFSQQITKGGWLLKMAEERANGRVNYDPPLDPDDDRNYYYSGPMTQGNHQRRYDAPVQYFDGLLSIDGQTVHMDNGATASFYFYTPHFHGNQNFVSIFERWFGPTKGSVLLKGSGPTVYVVGSDPSVAYGVPSGQVLDAYGLQGIPVTNVSDAYIASLNTTSMLTPLFLRPNDGTVFLADNGRAYGIASGAVCTQWALPCDQANMVSKLPYAVTSRMAIDRPLGNLMLRNNTVFLMNEGTKRPFIGPSDLGASPYASERPIVIYSPLNSNQPTGTPAFYSNNFFRTANGAIYYYSYSANQYFTFSSFDNFKNWWGGENVAPDWFSSFNTTPPTVAAIPTDFATDSGVTYMVAGSQAFRMPASPTNVTPTNLSTYPALQALLQPKAKIAVDGTSAVRIPSGTIFGMEGSTLRPIPSLTDLSLLYSPQKVYNLPATLTNGYSTGKFMIPSGRIIKLNGGDTIYLLGDDKYLWAVGTLREVNAATRWVPNGLQLDAASVDSVGSKSYTSIIKFGGNYYAVQPDGSARLLPASILNTQKDTAAMPISGPISNKVPFDSRAIRFIYINGTIFSVEGSAIRPIANFSTYSVMGGDSNNTIQVNASANSIFNIGTAL